MTSPTVTKECPHCGQRLRVPANIGGRSMACPSCNGRLFSLYKVQGRERPGGPALLTRAMLTRLGIV